MYRHGTEKRLREREQWMSTTLRSITDAVISVDMTGRVTFSNHAAEGLTGARFEDALGRLMGEIIYLVDDRGRPVEETPLEQVLRRRQPLETVEARLLDTAKGVIRLIHASAEPIVDGAHMFGAVMVFRDVTEQRRLERRLEVADRMASLGTMAAGVAHEINNPLSVVMVNTDLVAADLDDWHRTWRDVVTSLAERGLAPETAPVSMEQAVEALAEVRSAATRIADIVSGLRTFARPSERTRGEADVRRAAEWAIRATTHQIRHRARLVVDLRDVPTARIDENQLGQVMVNLLINATQAIAPGNAQDNEIAVRCRLAEEGHILVEVTDTGSGITEEHRGRIFEPFFTTKPVDVGTGLGLAICHGIVTRAGGNILVQSRPGDGSTFRLLLRPARTAAGDLIPDSQDGREPGSDPSPGQL